MATQDRSALCKTQNTTYVHVPMIHSLSSAVIQQLPGERKHNHVISEFTKPIPITNDGEPVAKKPCRTSISGYFSGLAEGERQLIIKQWQVPLFVTWLYNYRSRLPAYIFPVDVDSHGLQGTKKQWQCSAKQ